MLRVARVVSVVVAVLATSLGFIGVSHAAATGKAGRERPSVDFDITGFRCESKTTGRHVTRHGSVVINSTERGFTESTIALMAGTMTLKTRTVIRPNGSERVTGHWTLEPHASTGAIRGVLRGSSTGAGARAGADGFTATGRGVRALRGVAVRLTGTTGNATTEGCKADLSFAGSGTATYREQRAPVGAVVVTSTKSFSASVADLTAAIEANPNLRLVETVDHQAAAADRGLVLAPTTELFFGNPNLGTPLMQASQTTGIDLPQKMLIWEDLFGTVHVGYNAPSYLQSRHDIVGADGQLQTVANALAGLAGVATGTTVEPVFDAGTVRAGAGLVEVPTDRSAADAFGAIVTALEAAPPVNVAFTVEHDRNAASVGLELRPTKLVVFGNPSLGTVLMQTDQSVALDLPQKILVSTDADGQTTIAYNDPDAVAARHRIRGQDEVLDILAGALANFAAAGT